MDPDRIDDQPAPLRLTLELRPDGAGIAGSLCDELGGQHPFSGWLGLLTLLEAACLRSQVRRGRQTRHRSLDSLGGPTPRLEGGPK